MGTINVKAIEAKCFLAEDLHFVYLFAWHLPSYGAGGGAATYAGVYFVRNRIGLVWVGEMAEESP